MIIAYLIYVFLYSKPSWLYNEGHPPIRLCCVPQFYSSTWYQETGPDFSLLLCFRRRLPCRDAISPPTHPLPYICVVIPRTANPFKRMQLLYSACRHPIPPREIQSRRHHPTPRRSLCITPPSLPRNISRMRPSLAPSLIRFSDRLHPSLASPSPGRAHAPPPPWRLFRTVQAHRLTATGFDRPQRPCLPQPSSARLAHP
jgi:hypothetical protein